MCYTVYRFVRGLKPQIRLHVELQRPTTVNDAIRLAQAADSALYFTRPTYPVNRPTPSPTYMGPQPMQLGALTHPPELSLAERERLYREGRCFRCRQPGHLAEECTYFNTTRPTSSSTHEQPKN